MRTTRLLCALLVPAIGCAQVSGASGEHDAQATPPSGLVARYRMQEGHGQLLADESGNGHACRIHGATWVGFPAHYALGFDGASAYVDCGAVAAGLDGPFTYTVWLAPAVGQTTVESGILGGGFDSQLLTLVDGPSQSTPYDALYGYDGGGVHNVNRSVDAGGWLHAALTFDGQLLTLYVNGERVAQRAASASAAKAQPLWLGAIAAAGGGFYKGLLSDVSIYSRALGADEVAAQYGQQGQLDRDQLLAAPATHLVPVASAGADGYTVAVDAHGGLEIGDGASFFTLDSAFSYPGAAIGWDGFGTALESWEEGWLPAVANNGNGFTIAAQGREYSVVRQVVLHAQRIDIDDIVTSNTPDEDQPLRIVHTLTSGEPATTLELGQTADNPLVAFTHGTQLVGWVDGDVVGRAKLRSDRAGYATHVRHEDYFIAAGESYTFHASIYLLPASDDLFALVNRVRADWQANVTVQGSLVALTAGSPLAQDPVKLKAYLDRLGANIVLGGWIPTYTNTTQTLDQFGAGMRTLVGAVHAARPGTRVIGALETDWVAIDPGDVAQLSDLAPICSSNGGYADGYYTGSPTATAALAASDFYADSVRHGSDANGDLWIECYKSSPSQVSYGLGVNPVVGNLQHQHRLDEARYILDQAGLDGLYLDDFSQDFGSSAYDFGSYDGISALIDPATGQLTQYYANPTVQGLPSRLALLAQATPAQLVVANTYATSPDEQALAVNRFSEIELYLDPTPLRAGVEPPFQLEQGQGLLSTPVGFGMMAPAAGADLAQDFMLGILSYLRHGKLYYHDGYPQLPTSGYGSGDYGPVPHMFPFTPVELHAGWVKGKERIVAGRSFATGWDKAGPPLVTGFDLHGRVDASVAAKCSVAGSSGAWQISCALADWSELVAIE